MTPIAIFLWALLLVVQNASFTWVSRARNSGSDWYHAFAAVFSNGVWFAAFFFTFEGITQIRDSGNLTLAVVLGLIYVVATVTGSVSAGMFLRTYVERGKRKVGHYEEPTQEVKNSNAIRDLQRVVGEMAVWQSRLKDQYLSDTTNVDQPTLQGAWRREQARLRSLPGDEEGVVRAGLQEYVRDRDARERKYD